MCLYALFNDASNYAFRFLAGYGMVTGALFGHHGVRLQVGSSPPTQRCVAVPVRLLLLFQSSASSTAKPLRMHRRHNWRALVAVLVGIALPAPGWVLVSLMSRERVPFALEVMYDCSWFVSAAASGTVYGVLNLAVPRVSDLTVLQDS